MQRKMIFILMLSLATMLFWGCERSLDPYQPEETAQGILEIIHKLELFLREISGLGSFSFQPGGGSQAILAMTSIVQAYHESNREAEKRDEIITTIFSHPSDYSAD